MRNETKTSEYHDELMCADYTGLEESNLYQHVFKPTLIAALGDCSNQSVYDIGFGTGFTTKILSCFNVSLYLGMDISPHMIPYGEAAAELF
ncbi:class I SAM-dependent methyltransferase [Mycetohabitans endofungorum]|uniref:class I SAM-dependent methyltransferase n=1 Tax=Mycetohabitans endofungorum TaxID=417203 RepID=UPI002B05D90E|nr:class I SAM-dependent methyltransferase [Mycetohabitans endofungorum]